MTANRAPIQAQYRRLPTTAFSNMNIGATSHEIIDGRRGSEFGPPPDGVAGPQQLPDGRLRVLQVAENQGLLLARFHARRRPAAAPRRLAGVAPPSPPP